MRSTAERRQQILEYISDKRRVTMKSICLKFKICDRTARNDVQILACSYPIITENWRGGGVRVMDGWYLSRRYLRKEQEDLLRSLSENLSGKDQEIMFSILEAFAEPKVG